LIARHVSWPGPGEGAGELEQDGTSGQRDSASPTANRAAATIYDKIAGGEQGLDFIQAHHANHAGSNKTCRRRRQHASGPADFGEQGRDAGGNGGSVSAVERECGLRNPDSAEREFGAGEFDPSRKCWGSGGHTLSGQRLLGGREFADKEQAARGDQAGVKRIGAVAERLERPGGVVEFVYPRGQITRRQRDLGFGDLAPGLGEAFASAETAGRSSQELARALIVAELGHGNAAQGECRRVVAQRNAFERTKRITSRQQSRGRGDERVHGGRIL
jgi:hypothetical protein